jgi:hypothetical protein
LLDVACFYRYKKPEERGTLNQAMVVILPLVHQRCMQLVQDQSEQSVALQKQILKCFFALIQVCLFLKSLLVLCTFVILHS